MRNETDATPEFADANGPEIEGRSSMDAVLEFMSGKEARLDYLQIAQNGEWQASTKIRPTDNAEDIDFESISTAGVSLEVFYRLSDGSHAFIGFRCPDETNGSPSEFIESVYRAITNSSGGSPRDALLAASIAASGMTDTYTERDIDRVVAMVVDYWTELPTKVIWRPGESAPSAATLRSKLGEAPQLLTNDKNPISLEIDFGAPGLWIGLEVSRQNGLEYQLDDTKVAEVLGLLGTE